ncbi:MAG: PTS lactose/cellobiose transporter subunit IIA [Peptoniphilaceae bacterium]|nr:PTS lactose/cellobiose transporter subunit IIA [Peptoniphilaceae bacterium]MDD7383675.1 PTS lactose/cellobiose transporter subunit IIA [Peptoniphilaceae bacterium]MDY3738772.1 PTS lactose/cellobiose transporter subunit IIA [Peptoniphilaceae bacterium]
MDKNDIIFKIITYAADASDNAKAAIEEAKKFNFEKADELIEKANESYLVSHDEQSKLITLEGNGQKNDLNVLLIHALDHLTMSNIRIENAKNLIELYKEVNKLKNN